MKNPFKNIFTQIYMIEFNIFNSNETLLSCFRGSSKVVIQLFTQFEHETYFWHKRSALRWVSPSPVIVSEITKALSILVIPLVGHLRHRTKNPQSTIFKLREKCCLEEQLSGKEPANSCSDVDKIFRYIISSIIN